MATITILTKNNTLTVKYLIDFTTVEMPYGARGFRFNGSSHADPAELEKYWQFVEQIFEEAGITTDEYITLLEINLEDNTL